MINKKIFIASDHAGFLLKQYLVEKLQHENIIDLGTKNIESCDYPIFTQKLVHQILSSSQNKYYGILICGTGIGMSIAANRNTGIRAALCFNEKMAEMSRKHNNANVIIFGANIIDKETALECVQIFFKTEFEYGRHEGRLHLIDKQIKGD